MHQRSLAIRRGVIRVSTMPEKEAYRINLPCPCRYRERRLAIESWLFTLDRQAAGQEMAEFRGVARGRRTRQAGA